MRKCKNCKEKFDPKYNSVQMVCSIKCSIEYSKQLEETKKAKEWVKRKKILKEKIKTHKDYVKELQVVFNKYIRLRDKDKPCISCLKPLGSKYDAGHYRSAGGNPELRFKENNVHAQCVYCNQHLHGNLIDYRINLIKRIGLEEVELLENYHIPMKYSVPELVELKVIYKDKIKKLEKK
jgi:hypothetical protein